MHKILLRFFSWLVCVLALHQGFSQPVSSSTTLKELLQLAATNYPLLKAKALEIKAAERGVDISKKTIIPSLDAAYQVNYATYNNITGMAYPQFLLPISGPPSAENHYSGVFGSATSLLLNWQPVTFGQRQSQIDFSKAGLQYAKADANNEIFQHKVKVINAYLDVVTATALEKVYRENLSRTSANLAVAKTLVINGIKPGVDTALVKAEVSRAKVELLNSEKAKEQALITLSALLATDQLPAVTDTTYFSKLPATLTSVDTVSNSLVSLYSSNVELSKVKRKMLAKTMMPALGTWATTYARGSGADNNGNVHSLNGLGLQRYNYGLGLQLSIPILQFAKVHPQLAQQDFQIKANEEKLNEVVLQVKKQIQQADTALSAALRICRETPLYYESANYSYRALRSRYESGLANYADLMQAQYGLIRAAADNKLSYMAVWKGLLYKAAVNGDLNLFLNQVN